MEYRLMKVMNSPKMQHLPNTKAENQIQTSPMKEWNIDGNKTRKAL
jgi:hypothetical protein